MYNRTHITKVNAAAPVQILFNVQNQMSVGVKIAQNFAGAVTENGRKIVKAGTPLTGDLTDRSVPSPQLLTPLLSVSCCTTLTSLMQLQTAPC